jgi:hypothetical protein
MFEILKNGIEILKQKVQFNLEVITKNEKKIKEILKEPISVERSKKLNDRFAFNKSLLKENKEALQIQKSLLNYLENYKVDIDDPDILSEIDYLENDFKPDAEISREDYFDLTISEAICFDNRHPYFNDKKFIQDLLKYYTEHENYEMCSVLLKSTKKISQN